MTADTSIWSYVINAGFVVRCVMVILLFASVASWTIIIERIRYYKSQLEKAKSFEQRFWSGITMNDLYQQLSQEPNAQSGLSKIFTSGFKAFTKLQATGIHDTDNVIAAAQRAMQIEETDLLDEAEQPLSTLATIGSVSPFVGLFGTVWGIMTAFQALGTVQQASIAVVAPSIAEALIATAFGLFAAIPAVIAYNQFSQKVTRLQVQSENFSAELSNILQRAITK